MTLIWILVGVLILLLLTMLIAFLASDLIRGRRYLIMEIHRTSGKERKMWKKRLRQLYFETFIPFYHGKHND